MPKTPNRGGEAAPDAASQTTPPSPALESAGALQAQEPANQRDTAAGAPQAAENPQEAASAAGAAQPQSAGKSLAGLRGSDYVQALAGQPSTTLQVPLLPAERRGDWERAKGQKIPVTARQVSQQNGSGASWLVEREHALAALIVELQRPGASRFDQIDLNGSPTRSAIDRLSDYLQQARLRAQVQTGKKWNAAHLYLVPVEDA
ncbi:MAG TPA: hypothetical protein VF099_19375 [Ktedonobacterales bacterium]